MKTFSQFLEAKGDPTRLNLYTMYSVLRDNGGMVRPNSASSSLNS